MSNYQCKVQLYKLYNATITIFMCLQAGGTNNALTLLYVPPPPPTPYGFGLWSLPELSEGPLMLAQFIFDIYNLFSESFLSFFKNVFYSILFFLTPLTQKKIFCTFGQKITYFSVLGWQHVNLTIPKCFLEAYSNLFSNNNSK